MIKFFYWRMPWTPRNVLHTHNICLRCFFIALHAFEKQGLNKKAIKITKLHLVEISIYHWFEYMFWEKFAFLALFHFYVSYDQKFFYWRMPWTLRNILHSHNICLRCFLRDQSAINLYSWEIFVLVDPCMFVNWSCSMK